MNVATVAVNKHEPTSSSWLEQPIAALLQTDSVPRNTASVCVSWFPETFAVCFIQQLDCLQQQVSDQTESDRS